MTSIRRMCLDHHPGLDSGGTLWFQDLTAFPQGLLSPTFPLLIAGLHYVNVQISFQNIKAAALPGILGLLAKYYKLYLDILAIPLCVIGFYIPQGSLIYWATNNSFTLIQQLSLKNPYIRNKLGLAPERILKKRIPAKDVMLENGNILEHVVPAESNILQRDIPAETVSPEKLLDVSLEYLAAGHQDKALPLLRIAIEKDPELVRALVAMGQILCSRKSFEEAAECFERAISKIQLEEENTLLVLATFGAGVSRIWQGRKPEGIEHLKRIADLKVPDAPMDKAMYYKGLVMLGSTLFGDGEKLEAAKYLKIAATYDPGVNAYLKECEEG
ncbi:ALBINO3-like protein 3, mitochondrial isoform X2 [Asparagus officinalis]|nr:ALBINO3-like protein 3, mitochondrial isoform X2 [Asparagus officinalis]